MKRVLLLGPVPPPYGGIASVMDAIKNSVLARDHNFDVFEREEIFPPAYRGLLGKNIFRLKRFGSFFRKLSLGSYDFVHLQSDFNGGFVGSAIFMLIARLARTKVLLHLHGTDWDHWYSRQTKWKQLRSKLALRLPNRILVLYSAWQFNIKKLIPNADVHVLGNRIEITPSPGESDVEQVRHDLALTEKNFVVVTVGFVGHRKGSHYILDAVPQIAHVLDSVRFILVGGEEFRGESVPILERIDQEKLGKWIVATGEVPREKVKAFLACADVFLLPSTREGMPISIMEAMRAGVPVISTKVGAIPEMIHTGKNGVLINPGAPDEIVEAVLHLYYNQSLRARLAKESRRTFEEKFEISGGIRELAVIYDTM